jgi:ribonuclease D
MANKKSRDRKRKTTDLTLKQQKLVNALPTAASVSEAGRQAGYFDAPTAHRALESIREKMPQVLERHGLTPDFAAKKCLSLMNA